MVSELIGKYIWLIQILSAAGERGLSLQEITGKYERRYGQKYSRRTFNNHRIAVEDVFGIEIECDRRTNRYSVPFSDSVMDGDESISWLINTFTVNSLLSLGKERLSGRVSVEEVPSGQKFLTTIMQAMEDERELEMEYGKYISSHSEVLHVQPFAVKEHERRWYLVGFCRERALTGTDKAANSDSRAWRVYGLDRIVSLRETGERFRMPKGFDVDEIFSQSFGIYFPKEGQKPETILLRASGSEAKYLRDLPLHRSQKDEGPADGGGRIFSLRVIPNENLIMEFCRHADRIEILEPEDVRSAVREELEKAYKLYKLYE